MIKVATIGIVALCTYGAVRFTGVLVFDSAVSGMAGMSIVLAMFLSVTELHRRSVYVLRSWGIHSTVRKDRVYSLRTPREFRAVRAVLASLYFVDRPMVLTMLVTFVKESASFLILHR